MNMQRKNESYKPKPAVIKSVTVENPRVRTFRLAFLKKEDSESFSFRPGQFAMISVPGIGEAPFSMCSSPYDRGSFEISVRKIGNVTNSMFSLNRGDVIGVRGPFGHGYPLEKCKGRDVLIVAGGIGFPPLGSAIECILKSREDYGKVWVIYGVKDFEDIIYRNRMKRWTSHRDVNISITIETPCEEWKGCIGRVTDIFSNVRKSGRNMVGLSCGPPIMLKFVIDGFRKLGIEDANMYVSLERMMQCGIGKCGHCNIGNKYVCTDGPVFSYAEIKNMLEKVW